LRASGGSLTSGQWVRGAAEWARARSARVVAAAAVPERDPRDAELARLGNDDEALGRLAAHGGGSVLNIVSNNYDSFSWPALPGGQARETRAVVSPLTPPVVTALLIALLLSTVWTIRKRLRLD
jgi:hypothetical protein